MDHHFCYFGHFINILLIIYALNNKEPYNEHSVVIFSVQLSFVKYLSTRGLTRLKISRLYLSGKTITAEITNGFASINIFLRQAGVGYGTISYLKIRNSSSIIFN